MKNLLLLVTLFLGTTVSLRAQEATDAEMKAMMAYGTPGEMHQMLARDNGAWREQVTMWMKPGAEAQTFTASVQSEMLMDGRYQQQTHSGEMMGMPFRGISTTGYDNARNVFINTWIDNFGTGIMTSEGRYNPATKSIEFKGKVTDPMAGGKLMPFRQVLRFISDKEQRVEMYMMHAGKEFKSMEIVLTRG
jgi:hypothetical protein